MTYGKVVNCEIDLNNVINMGYAIDGNTEALFTEMIDKKSGHIYTVANLDGFRIEKIINNKIIKINNKIFLGGTCAKTTWRTELEKVLNIPSFNPVVDDWTPECQEEERLQKNNLCNIHLYVITKEMQGVFSIAEVIDSTYQKGKITILHVIPDGFEKAQLKSLKAVCDMVKINGGIAYIDSELNITAKFINNSFD